MSQRRSLRFLISVCVLLLAVAGLAQNAQEKPSDAAAKDTQPAAQEKPPVQQPSTPAANEGKTEAAAKGSVDSGAAGETASMPLPAGSKVFIAPMPIDFHRLLKDAIKKKKVPLQIVEDRSQAEFEITGTAESQKAGTAKKVIMLSWHSSESASIKVTDLKSSVVIYAYSYQNSNSAHGPRTSAESCAKHLKNKVEGKE